VAAGGSNDYVRRMKLAIASDHAAIGLKADLAEWLRAAGHEVADLGTNGPESVDYPDFGFALAEHVAAGKAERGIAICGSGIGISIAVNRNPAVRCALVSEPLSATLSRHNGDLAKAQSQIEQAMGRAPTNPEIGLEGGLIAVLAGRDDAARRSWQSVVRIAPGTPAADKAAAYLTQLDEKAATTP
jgi:RpiB/LacA/LacB family sugar-phosphate isomerase